VRLRFLGGARTVTGSMHLVETERGSVLLECGLFQGRREEANRRNRDLPREARRANAVILSHAHIDHSGALPSLVKAGWKGEIHLTPATGDLATVMLRDAAKIQEYDAEHLRKHGRAVEPIYDGRDADAAIRRFKGHAYGADFEPIPGVTARFVDAGHILGSAAVHLTVKERSGTTRLAFTGDLGRPGMPLLRDPEPPGEADVAISECTYGDRPHEPVEDTERRLFEIVDRTARRGGRVLIPAFAVGRTQAIVYFLHRLRAAGRLGDLPIFVDSPMAVEATRVFSRHAELFDGEAREFLAGRGRLFSAARTSYVESAAESRDINRHDGPAVILSASGMCEAGRVLHHLKFTLGNPANTVLFVGFQAEHTLGRRLLDGAKEARVLGEMYDVKCEVARLNGLSAHADCDGIEAWLRAAGPSLRAVHLVHGEPERAEALRDRLAGRGLPKASIPAPGDVVEVAAPR
jgi:metallo-beta-lactamase family protein